MSDRFLQEEVIPEDFIPRSGERVFWFHDGDPKNTPCPAIVNVNSAAQRSLSLTVFTVNGPMLRDGVKHVCNKASEIDRRDNGGWAWNRVPGTQPEPKK